MERKRLTASERDALVRMDIGGALFRVAPEALRNRLQTVKYGMRDAAMLATKADRLVEAMLDTVPVEQLETLRRTLRMSSVTIGVRRPGADERDMDGYGLYVPLRVVNELLNGCHEHCMTCDLDGVGRRRCALRKALDAVPNDVPDKTDGDCPYFSIM